MAWKLGYPAGWDDEPTWEDVELPSWSVATGFSPWMALALADELFSSRTVFRVHLEEPSWNGLAGLAEVSGPLRVPFETRAGLYMHAGRVKAIKWSTDDAQLGLWQSNEIPKYWSAWIEGVYRLSGGLAGAEITAGNGLYIPATGFVIRIPVSVAPGHPVLSTADGTPIEIADGQLLSVA